MNNTEMLCAMQTRERADNEREVTFVGREASVAATDWT